MYLLRWEQSLTPTRAAQYGVQGAYAAHRSVGGHPTDHKCALDKIAPSDSPDSRSTTEPEQQKPKIAVERLRDLLFK